MDCGNWTKTIFLSFYYIFGLGPLGAPAPRSRQIDISIIVSALDGLPTAHLILHIRYSHKCKFMMYTALNHVFVWVMLEKSICFVYKVIIINQNWYALLERKEILDYTS